jgi:hypothetical protein
MLGPFTLILLINIPLAVGGLKKGLHKKIVNNGRDRQKHPNRTGVDSSQYHYQGGGLLFEYLKKIDHIHLNNQKFSRKFQEISEYLFSGLSH